VVAAFQKARREHAHALNVLVARARAAGVLRDGVDADDVRAGLIAIASLRQLPPQTSTQVIGKLADLILAGLQAPTPYVSPGEARPGVLPGDAEDSHPGRVVLVHGVVRQRPAPPSSRGRSVCSTPMWTAGDISSGLEPQAIELFD
jgi:hypothetical protein